MFGMIESLNDEFGPVLYEVTKQRRDYQSHYRLRNKRVRTRQSPARFQPTYTVLAVRS